MPSVPVETLRTALKEKAEELSKETTNNGNGKADLSAEQIKSAKGNIKGDRTGNVGKPVNAAS
jgi:hypothetical protein